MKSSLQRHRTQSGTGQSAFRVVVVVSCFVIMIASAWLINRSIFQGIAPTRAPANGSTKGDSYLGIIQLAPNYQGRCEQFELDNRSATLTAKGAGACLDATATVPAPAADPSTIPPNSRPSVGPAGRMKGIGDYFKAH